MMTYFWIVEILFPYELTALQDVSHNQACMFTLLMWAIRVSMEDVKGLSTDLMLTPFQRLTVGALLYCMEPDKPREPKKACKKMVFLSWLHLQVDPSKGFQVWIHALQKVLRSLFYEKAPVISSESGSLNDANPPAVFKAPKSSLAKSLQDIPCAIGWH